MTTFLNEKLPGVFVHNMRLFFSLLTASSLLLCKSSFANNPCAAVLLPPPPDSCLYFQGTTVGTAPSGTSSLPCSGVNNGDYWYTVVVPACGPDLTFNLLSGPPMTQTNGILYLFTGSCSNLLIHGCSTMFAPSYFATQTLLNPTPGDTIYIRVSDLGGTGPGSFQLCVFGSCPTAISPVNTARHALQIFPNPAQNELTLTSDHLSGKCEIEIDNILGQKIFSQGATAEQGKTELDISSIPSGIYLLRIQTGEYAFSKKLVITK